jgi:hypothetical protein
MKVSRSCYIKLVGDIVVRLYRHSDDLRLSCTDKTILDSEVALLQILFPIAKFVQPDVFLGSQYQRINLMANQMNKATSLVREQLSRLKK